MVVVEVIVGSLDADSLERFVDDLVAPDEARFGPPDVTELVTTAGDAVRLRQLLLADDEGEQVVHTSLGCVWPGLQTGTVLVMSAYFASPLEAEFVTDAVDDLARSLTMAPA